VLLLKHEFGNRPDWPTIKVIISPNFSFTFHQQWQIPQFFNRKNGDVITKIDMEQDTSTQLVILISNEKRKASLLLSVPVVPMYMQC
jgi:hypothetical protein